MRSQPLLRLDKTPATQRPPSADNVDLIYDAESGALKAVDSTGDVPFAGASVTAEAINAALEGNPLIVDYIQTTDQTGFTIPANSFGQKAGVPYFGDEPLANALTKEFSFEGVGIGVFAPGVQVFHIGSFTVPAPDAVDARSWPISFESRANLTDGGAAPSAGDDLYLLVRLGTGTVDFTEGSWVKLTPTALIELRKLKGSISLVASAGNLRPNFSFASQEIAKGATASTDATYFPAAATTITSDTSVTKPVGQATSFEFYLAGNWTVGDTVVGLVSGKLEISSGEILTGSIE